MNDTSGILDEALQRLHASGPERLGRLTNHGPMAVEALVHGGQARSVHRWLDYYRAKLEDMPGRVAPVTDDDWRAALGDPRRAADWIAHFEQQLAERPWRDVLAAWWPVLLPGIAGGSTHPVIRVGHAVRTLLGPGGDTAPRVAELAHGLGYWAARHTPLPARTPLALPPSADAAAALDAVRHIPVQDGGFPDRLAQLTSVPVWPPNGDRTVTDPDTARTLLTDLVTAAVHRYATHGHGEPIMLVHAATAPNAVLRILPALPRELWPASLEASWAASAAVTAAYAPAAPAAYEGTYKKADEEAAGSSFNEVFARAAAHGDDHTVKFADTALDVGDRAARTAALRGVELNPPAL
ncbi:questin oxidase family protein [Streptomyces aureoverticillatus]|uniref:questin oxidase family protein n=1 Tax=Streptomyces aureoverticillatus TaxID=66871 RepID=UPI0013D9B8E8|nr:questin oxidase family protein [Streptomyces aureoverticillatus]QIB45247.1 questin oxidase family protein [Streptomyces aureoverticillatus]